MSVLKIQYRLFSQQKHKGMLWIEADKCTRSCTHVDEEHLSIYNGTAGVYPVQIFTCDLTGFRTQ